MKKLVLTEQQYNYLVNNIILTEAENYEPTPQDIYNNMVVTNHGQEEEKPAFGEWKRVRKGNKMNIKNINTNEYISKAWYDWVGTLINGLAIVNNIGQGYNIINENGQLMLPNWHEDIDLSNDGKYVVADANGEYIKQYSPEDIKNGDVEG